MTELELHPLPANDLVARLEQIGPVLDSIKDEGEHQRLKKAVVHHLWARKGSSSVDEEL